MVVGLGGLLGGGRGCKHSKAELCSQGTRGKRRMALGLRGNTRRTDEGKRQAEWKRQRRQSAKKSHFAVDEMTEIEVVSPK